MPDEAVPGFYMRDNFTDSVQIKNQQAIGISSEISQDKMIDEYGPELL